ncbi:hypothetical protein ACN38_g6261 [Penicillium nordicum]|uniref:Uncharacterized protein n=1 Tax=Penicillium nordicum TaxID=229535 RepID=A0A0M8P8Y4_9EURO|nr:hypothetical protein ACN38_g6261 [Penicillium nordicum]
MQCSCPILHLVLPQNGGPAWSQLYIAMAWRIAVLCLGVISYMAIGSYSLLRRKKPSITIGIIKDSLYRYRDF